MYSRAFGRFLLVCALVCLLEKRLRACELIFGSLQDPRSDLRGRTLLLRGTWKTKEVVLAARHVDFSSSSARQVPRQRLHWCSTVRRPYGRCGAWDSCCLQAVFRVSVRSSKLWVSVADLRLAAWTQRAAAKQSPKLLFWI